MATVWIFFLKGFNLIHKEREFCDQDVIGILVWTPPGSLVLVIPVK